MRPDLKIVVNGLTAEEEQAFAAEVENDHRNVVGAWLTGAPAVPGRLMIFREKNRLFAEWRVRGGHRTVDEVVESRGSRGHRFDIPGDDSQYYVMLPGGALELRDKTALIAVAERIPLAKDRGRLAQRGLGIAGALAAKQDRAKAAVAAARARTATPAPSQPAVTVTQQTSAQAPPDAASPVAAFVSVAPKGIVPSPSIAETKAPVAPSEVAAALRCRGPRRSTTGRGSGGQAAQIRSSCAVTPASGERCKRHFDRCPRRRTSLEPLEWPVVYRVRRPEAGLARLV